MITENPDGGVRGDPELAETESQQIPFPGGAALVQGDAPKYRCYGHIILLDWEPTKMAGLIHIPESAKQAQKLSFHKVRVIAAGPECKILKGTGDEWVLLPAEAIMQCRWGNHVAQFSSESKILAVVVE